MAQEMPVGPFLETVGCTATPSTRTSLAAGKAWHGVEAVWLRSRSDYAVVNAVERKGIQDDETSLPAAAALL